MSLKESKKKKIERAQEVFVRLRKHYGEVVCTLDERFDPWRLLVAGILAAQCTDARVNLVTPDLFKRFPKPEDFANASASLIEPYISTCGLFRAKAKYIYQAAVHLQKNNYQVPDTMQELVKIPGVGRKIANLLLGELFGKPGLVVDTHCGRLANRLGLSDKKQAYGIEKDLCALLKPEIWRDWGLYMVTHGRVICKAKNPICQECLLNDICPTAKQSLS